MKLVSTVEQHLQNPTESVEQYVRAKRLELAKEMRGSIKVYLDTKYWLLFRDVRLGRPVSSEIIALLGAIETLIARNKAICPISVDIFAEIFKQSDPKTLAATVTLIDDLSRGVSILEFGERLRLEAYHFIREKTLGNQMVHVLNDLVGPKLLTSLVLLRPRRQVSRSRSTWPCRRLSLISFGSSHLQMWQTC